MVSLSHLHRYQSRNGGHHAILVSSRSKPHGLRVHAWLPSPSNWGLPTSGDWALLDWNGNETQRNIAQHSTKCKRSAKTWAKAHMQDPRDIKFRLFRICFAKTSCVWRLLCLACTPAIWSMRPGRPLLEGDRRSKNVEILCTEPELPLLRRRQKNIRTCQDYSL